jgi:replicative DNA helicase
MTQQGRTGAVPPGLGRLETGQPVPPAVSSKAAPRQGDIPYSIEAERSVLGGILLEAEMAWKAGIDRLLAPDDFFMREHQIIYRAMLSLREKKLTAVTVSTALSAMGLIDEVDRLVGPPWTEPYLVELMGDWMSPLWLEPHSQIIKDYSERRGMIKQAQRLAQAAHAPRETWKDLPEYTSEA